MSPQIVVPVLLKKGTSAALPTTPRVPASITTFAITAGDTVMHMTWQPPVDQGTSPVQDYGLYMTPAGTGTDLVFAGWTTNLSEQFTGLENGTTYDFAVTARNAVGESAMSNIETGMPESATCDATGDQLFDNASFNCGTDFWSFDPSYPATITDNGDGSVHLKADTEYGSLVPDNNTFPTADYAVRVVVRNIIGNGKVSIRDEGNTWHSQTLVEGDNIYPYTGDISTFNIGADNDITFEADFEFVGLETTAGAQQLDIDHDGLRDRMIATDGTTMVTIDADSTNIDLDGDGNADIVIPR